MACLHSYSEFVMLVCAVCQTGDLLMDDLREAVLYTLHIQDDVIVALVILFFIFGTSGEKKTEFPNLKYFCDSKMVLLLY